MSDGEGRQEVPDRQLAQDILARWREAERTLETLPPTSPEADRLKVEIAALRDQYQLVVRGARERGGNEPPMVREA